MAAARQLAPDGFDAVFALTGGESLERCLDVLRPGGRCAYPNGVGPEPDKSHGIEIASYDAVAGIREFERLGRAVEAAKLQVPIGAAIRSKRLRRHTSGWRRGTCSGRSCFEFARPTERGTASTPIGVNRRSFIGRIR